MSALGMRAPIRQNTTLRYIVSVLPYISAGVLRSSATALPGVAKRSLRAMSLRAKVSRPPAHFAQPLHRGGTPKRGTVQGPRAQNSPGGGPPEEKLKLVTADVVTIGGTVRVQPYIYIFFYSWPHRFADRRAHLYLG
jgi:hypothetical protein